MTIRGPFAVVLLVILFLSVAANLVIAGFVLARVAGPRPGGEIERIVSMGTRGFPAPIRRDIQERSRAQRSALAERVSAVQQARQRMFEAMRAEPFDRAALEAAFAEVRARTDELQRAGQAIVADAVTDAPPETRSRIRPPRGFRP